MAPFRSLVEDAEGGHAGCNSAQLVPSTAVGGESRSDSAVLERRRGGDPALPGAGVTRRPSVAIRNRALLTRREPVSEVRRSPKTNTARPAHPHGRTGSAGERLGVLALGQGLVIDNVERPRRGHAARRRRPRPRRPRGARTRSLKAAPGPGRGGGGPGRTAARCGRHPARGTTQAHHDPSPARLREPMGVRLRGKVPTRHRIPVAIVTGERRRQPRPVEQRHRDSGRCLRGGRSRLLRRTGKRCDRVPIRASAGITWPPTAPVPPATNTSFPNPNHR
jgi:hypothetical protein